MTAKPRRIIKRGQAFPPVDKKQCPAHREDLIYVPTRIIWQCPECNYFLYPDGVVTNGVPTVVKGDLELMTLVDEDGYVSHYIRCKEVMLSIPSEAISIATTVDISDSANTRTTAMVMVEGLPHNTVTLPRKTGKKK